METRGGLQGLCGVAMEEFKHLREPRLCVEGELKALKVRIKEWRRVHVGNLEGRINKAMTDLKE